MKKIAILFLGLTMSIVNVGISVVHAAGSATLTLSPTNTSVVTGDTFSLSVLVNPNEESLDTARLELDYDASKLEVLSFDLGSLFPNLSPDNEIDNTNGDLSYGAYKFGTSVTSSGTFATVTFHALSSGTTTISVLSSSKLISDGEETLNASSLGSSVITITGEDVESEATSDTQQEQEEETEVVVDEEASLEEQALVYFGAFYGRMPSSDDDWSALHCIAYGGCQGDPRDIAAEEEALVIFGAKYAKMPSTDMEWNVIHTLAYTDFLDTGEEEEVIADEEEEVVEEEETEEETDIIVDEEASLEEQALVYFGAFYGRMPSSDDDWSALHCIAYGGCQGDPRDIAAEEEALVIFGAKYAKMPSTDMEWNVIHTLAYTDFLDTGEEEVVTEETPVEETTNEETVVEEELTIEQQAIGWFGALTGYLPSTDVDWLAIDYMVNGYTPEVQDIEAESEAITLFVNTWGHLPSSEYDWNVIAAIAYSGAF